MKRLSRFLIVAVMAIGSLCLIPAQADVVLTRLGDLEGSYFSSIAEDVSDDGSVVVGSSIAHKVSFNSYYEAFRWENGTMEPLGDLDNGDFISSAAYGISPDGSVIVGEAEHTVETENVLAAYVRTGNGPMIQIGESPQLEPSGALSISPDGQCIGGFYRLTGEYLTRAVLWENGVPSYPELSIYGSDYNYGAVNAISNPYGLDDQRTVVGKIAGVDLIFFPAFWIKTGGTLTPTIIRYSDGEMCGISGDGQRIVGMAEHFSIFKAFYVDVDVSPTSPQWLDFPVDSVMNTAACARDISSDKSIIVGYASNINPEVAHEAVMWVWSLKEGDSEPKYHPIVLNQYADDNGVDRDGFFMLEARAITPDGEVIVGQGINSNQDLEAFHLRIAGSNGGGGTLTNPLGNDDVDEHGNTRSDSLGPINISHFPNVYSFGIDGYFWCAEETITDEGAWFYRYPPPEGD